MKKKICFYLTDHLRQQHYSFDNLADFINDLMISCTEHFADDTVQVQSIREELEKWSAVYAADDSKKNGEIYDFLIFLNQNSSEVFFWPDSLEMLRQMTEIKLKKDYHVPVPANFTYNYFLWWVILTLIVLCCIALFKICL